MNAISSVNFANSSAAQKAQARRNPLENEQLLNKLAEKLGVESTKLKDALQEARTSGERGKDLLSFIADKLSLEPEVVQTAFRQLRAGSMAEQHRHHTPPVSETTPPSPEEYHTQTQGTGAKINVVV